jgi:hypothetical protein
MHARQDADGYLRVACPAVMGKVRCPLRPQSMTLSRDRPEILTPPEHPPASCTQQTITVGPDVVAKTRQKHDYPSPAWRLSYNRRTAAERLNSTVKDAATASIARGWIRLTGLAPVMPWTACLLAAPTSASLPPGTSASKTARAAPNAACRPDSEENAAQAPRRSPWRQLRLSSRARTRTTGKPANGIPGCPHPQPGRHPPPSRKASQPPHHPDTETTARPPAAHAAATRLSEANVNMKTGEV